MMDAITQSTHAPHLLARLDHAVASLSRGGTLVLGPRADGTRAALEAEGLKRCTAVAGGSDAALRALARVEPESVRTVVLGELLPDDDDAARALAAAAFAAVRPGGRLVVVVPNESAEKAPGARRRRALEHLLKPLGRAKLAVDQPYRWLVMYVKKRAPGAAGIAPTVAERYRIIAGLCRGRVLELGCGPGHLAAEIARAGHEVVGMDLNRPKIEEAKASYPHIRFFQGDAAELPDVGSFDTVVVAEVLEHVPAEVGDRILDAARRSLAPGGRIVVSVPNEKCIPHPNHVRLFDERTLRELLRPFGRPRVVTDQPYKWLLMYADHES